MVAKELLEKLISIDNKNEPLEYDAGSEKLITASGISYAVVDNVPVMLPDNFDTISYETDIHKQYNSKFSYIEHYKIDAEVGDYFEKLKGETAHENRRLHEKIKSIVPSRTRNILDVGCGSGWVAAHFCKKNIEVVSMDVSLSNATKVLKKYPDKNHFAVNADVYHLPFKDESFDCIIASEIIEHVPDPKLFIQNLFGLLNKDGTLIITTPFNEKIQYTICVHCNKPTPLSAHLHSFNENNLSELVKKINIMNYSTSVFSNFILFKTPFSLITRFLPYLIWNMTDKLFNLFNKKKSRLLLKIRKY
jgi:2-polyprenyl-3-methyl-5-hydroxy-6-metoxy-1,4-benzoquinol methylase